MIKSIELCINHSIKVDSVNTSDAVISFEPGYNVLIDLGNQSLPRLIDATGKLAGDFKSCS